MTLHKHQLYLLEQHSESFKKSDQQLLGLTLRVNPWLWNQVLVWQNVYLYIITSLWLPTIWM